MSYALHQRQLKSASNSAPNTTRGILSIDALTERIEEAMEPFRAAREFLATIPGVSLKVAEVIIAETGTDMTVFETPGRLAS